MSKKRKVILGFLTALPAIYLILFIGYFTTIVDLMSSNPVLNVPKSMWVFELVHFLYTFLAIGLMVYYICHALKNKALAENKSVWVALLIVLGPVTMPIYFYNFIWKARG